MLISEWTKIRTIRSTVWTLSLAFVICTGLAVLFGHMVGAQFDRMSQESRANFDPVMTGFYSLTLGQISLVAFGVLLVGSEYTSGTIRASLAAVPRRALFYGSKVLAGTMTASVFSVITVFVTFFAAQAALGPHGTSLGEPGVLRAVLGTCAYLTLMCAFSIGVATMLRSTALTLGIMIPLLFLNSQGLGNVPKIGKVVQFLPDQAGAAMMQVTEPDRSFLTHRDFGPWTGLAILLAWTAASLIGGYLVLRRRDT
jgi:ABC-type transport system involved in multi-copper enzyme maturation permease subunit